MLLKSWLWNWYTNKQTEPLNNAVLKKTKAKHLLWRHLQSNSPTTSLLKRIFCLQLPVDHRSHSKCSITQAQHLKSLAFEYLSLRFKFAGDLSTTLNHKQPRNQCVQMSSLMSMIYFLDLICCCWICALDGFDVVMGFVGLLWRWWWIQDSGQAHQLVGLVRPQPKVWEGMWGSGCPHQTQYPCQQRDEAPHGNGKARHLGCQQWTWWQPSHEERQQLCCGVVDSQDCKFWSNFLDRKLLLHTQAPRSRVHGNARDGSHCCWVPRCWCFGARCLPLLPTWRHRHHFPDLHVWCWDLELQTCQSACCWCIEEVFVVVEFDWRHSRAWTWKLRGEELQMGLERCCSQPIWYIHWWCSGSSRRWAVCVMLCMERIPIPSWQSISVLVPHSLQSHSKQDPWVLELEAGDTRSWAGIAGWQVLWGLQAFFLSHSHPPNSSELDLGLQWGARSRRPDCPPQMPRRSARQLPLLSRYGSVADCQTGQQHTVKKDREAPLENQEFCSPRMLLWVLEEHSCGGLRMGLPWSWSWQKRV